MPIKMVKSLIDIPTPNVEGEREITLIINGYGNGRGNGCGHGCGHGYGYGYGYGDGRGSGRATSRKKPTFAWRFHDDR